MTKEKKDEILNKKDLLDFGTSEYTFKSTSNDDDNLSDLINMESNIKNKMQPVRGTTIEQTKKVNISDTPVSTKCPKCGSVVMKTEKVLRKFLILFRRTDQVIKVRKITNLRMSFVILYDNLDLIS